jgi:L-lactate dehydrogenase complex protein LldG
MLKNDENIQKLNDSSRATILGGIRKATEGKTAKRSENPPVSYVRSLESTLQEDFQSHLEELKGEIMVARDLTSLVPLISDLIDKEGFREVICPEEKLGQSLRQNGLTIIPGVSLSENTALVITGCEYLVANLGAIIVSSAQAGSRRMFCYPPVHLVIADASRLVETLDEAYILLLEKHKQRLPSMISIIAGPSRTADIEKTLVLGAHGPKRLIVCLINAMKP